MHVSNRSKLSYPHPGHFIAWHLHACSPEIPPAVLKDGKRRDPGGVRPQNAGAKANRDESRLPCPLHFLLGPAALRTDRHEHGRRRGATIDHLAQTLRRVLPEQQPQFGQPGSATSSSKEHSGCTAGSRVLPDWATADSTMRRHRAAAAAPTPAAVAVRSEITGRMSRTPSSAAFSSTNENRSPLGSAWASTSSRVDSRRGSVRREHERAAPIAPEVLDPDPVFGARTVGRRKLVSRPEPQHRPQMAQAFALELQPAVGKSRGRGEDAPRLSHGAAHRPPRGLGRARSDGSAALPGLRVPAVGAASGRGRVKCTVKSRP